jgi:hypothetical protein
MGQILLQGACNGFFKIDPHQTLRSLSPVDIRRQACGLN